MHINDPKDTNYHVILFDPLKRGKQYNREYDLNQENKELLDNDQRILKKYLEKGFDAIPELYSINTDHMKQQHITSSDRCLGRLIKNLDEDASHSITASSTFNNTNAFQNALTSLMSSTPVLSELRRISLLEHWQQDFEKIALIETPIQLNPSAAKNMSTCFKMTPEGRIERIHTTSITVIIGVDDKYNPESFYSHKSFTLISAFPNSHSESYVMGRIVTKEEIQRLPEYKTLSNIAKTFLNATDTFSYDKRFNIHYRKAYQKNSNPKHINVNTPCIIENQPYTIDSTIQSDKLKFNLKDSSGSIPEWFGEYSEKQKYACIQYLDPKFFSYSMNLFRSSVPTYQVFSKYKDNMDKNIKRTQTKIIKQLKQDVQKDIDRQEFEAAKKNLIRKAQEIERNNQSNPDFDPDFGEFE